ncbi:MAG: hypothetical protein HUK02_01145, partial [Bacteroidaceae bacterium]|nr:hypothetical protein [Bacteroidaceae bacterium]
AAAVTAVGSLLPCDLSETTCAILPAAVPAVGLSADVPAIGRSVDVPAVGSSALVPAVSCSAAAPAVGRSADVPAVGCSVDVPAVGSSALVPAVEFSALSTAASSSATYLRDAVDVTAVRLPQCDRCTPTWVVLPAAAPTASANAAVCGDLRRPRNENSRERGNHHRTRRSSASPDPWLDAPSARSELALPMHSAEGTGQKVRRSRPIGRNRKGAMRTGLWVAALLLTSCQTLWKEPTVESAENNAPRVMSVAFSDTATVVEMEKEVGHGFLISGNSLLVTETMQAAPLRWTEGVPATSGQHSTEKARFRLGFGAVGKGAKRLDFTEGAGTKDYRIWGIRPKGKAPADYAYRPTRTPLDGDDAEFLRTVLVKYAGKVIVLQLVDMASDESIDVLRQSEAVRRSFAQDPRVAFVFLSRPDDKEYGEGTQDAIVAGTTAYMERVSPATYERLRDRLTSYMPPDRVICLDPSLNVLTPGLHYQSPPHFEKQLELLSWKE